MARAGGPPPGVPFSLPHSAHGGWPLARVPLPPALALLAAPAPTAGEEAAGEGTGGETSGGTAAGAGAAGREGAAGTPWLGGAGM